jgi:hypothetical protein
MNSEPKDRFSGRPLSQWLAEIPNELEIDAVGLWQIIPRLRRDFGLEREGVRRIRTLSPRGPMTTCE